MKRIAVIATEKEFAEYLKSNVERYMKRYAEFTAYSMAEIEAKDIIEEDFVLLSAFTIYQKVCEKKSESTEILIVSLSLNKNQIEVLKQKSDGYGACS